jgi:hypothetical protein
MWDNGSNRNFTRAVRYVLNYTTMTLTKVWFAYFWIFVRWFVALFSIILSRCSFHRLGLAIQCYDVFRFQIWLLWKRHNERGRQCHLPRFPS